VIRRVRLASRLDLSHQADDGFVDGRLDRALARALYNVTVQIVNLSAAASRKVLQERWLVLALSHAALRDLRKLAFDAFARPLSPSKAFGQVFSF
jgi:hypothetical protein